MSTLDIFRQDVESIRTVAFDRYDRLAPSHDETLQVLAWIYDNRQLRENPVRLQEEFFYPQAFAWVDEIVIAQSIDTIDYTVPLTGWNAVAPFNRVNVGRPNTIAKLERIVPRLPEGIFKKEKQLLLDVFRKNPLTVDGQNFFSTAHPKPNGELFSNVLEPAWADPSAPTLQELADLIEAAKTRFASISVLESELIDDAAMDERLLVIAHNDSHQTQLRRLRTVDKIGDVMNSLQNGFRLWRDAKPAAGQENYFEIVHTTPDTSGPKPAIYVLDKDPELVTLDENRVSNGYYGLGFEKIFGVKPGIPNTTLQVRPQQA